MREERISSTWRGYLIRHSQVIPFFGRCGLCAENVIPDGKGTRWIVAGRKV